MEFEFAKALCWTGFYAMLAVEAAIAVELVRKWARERYLRQIEESNERLRAILGQER